MSSVYTILNSTTLESNMSHTRYAMIARVDLGDESSPLETAPLHPSSRGPDVTG
jgi:hypothetical protein